MDLWILAGFIISSHHSANAFHLFKLSKSFSQSPLRMPFRRHFPGRMKFWMLFVCVCFDTKPDSSLENWEWPRKDFKQNLSYKLELGGYLQLFHGKHQESSRCINIVLCSGTSRLSSSHWRGEEGYPQIVLTLTGVFIIGMHHEPPLVNQFIKWWTIRIEALMTSNCFVFPGKEMARSRCR